MVRATASFSSSAVGYLVDIGIWTLLLHHSLLEVECEGYDF